MYSVIESTEEHSEAGPFIAEIQRRYPDVLQQVTLAKDVDPKVRGNFGLARIELQEGALPQKRKPCRMIGEKEEAFRALIQKFLDRGWIEPTDSEWGSQAFLVSKPSTNKQDAWRMVVDYRYVNTVTKDFPYPLPLIEYLICKESQNRTWSIFDLESGLHQMHLDPESRALTAFVTPWSNYQWLVLPMGIKQAPALFQRLVNWTLRDVPRSRAYVDDILTGKPLPEIRSLIKLHSSKDSERTQLCTGPDGRQGGERQRERAYSSEARNAQAARSKRRSGSTGVNILCRESTCTQSFVTNNSAEVDGLPHVGL